MLGLTRRDIQWNSMTFIVILMAIRIPNTILDMIFRIHYFWDFCALIFSLNIGISPCICLGGVSRVLNGGWVYTVTYLMSQLADVISYLICGDARIPIILSRCTHFSNHIHTGETWISGIMPFWKLKKIINNDYGLNHGS